MPNALIIQRRARAAKSTGNFYEESCPTIRIPTVTDLKVAQEVPGGWQTADFTIPAIHNRHGLDSMPHSALDQPIWIMDGLSTMFHGVVARVTPNGQGELEVSCDGSYRLLGSTRMRSVWSDSDLSQLAQAPGCVASGSMNVNSAGNLVFSFPKGTALNAGDYIAADYFLFGEIAGVRDSKKMDAWQITIGGASTFTDLPTAMEVRIYGLSGPSDTTPKLLQTFTAAGSRMETSDGSHGGDNVSPWINDTGFRCFRVGLWQTIDDAGPRNQDHSAVITSFQVSTRGRADVGLLPPVPSTSAIAADIWTDGQSYDLHVFAVEEEPTATGKAVTGNIPDSGQKAFGVSFPIWASPQEIIEAMQALDGGIAGMWGPAQVHAPGATVVPVGNTSRNHWYRQPAELTYKPWNELGDAELHVRLSRGAEWTPDGQPDDVVSADYATYSSLKGKALSVFTEDPSAENIVYEQGLHKADDYTIDPSVNTVTATTLGTTYVKQRRQPTLTGTLALSADRVGSWETPGGARGDRLYDLRPCVVRIVDAKGPKAGHVTRLEYTHFDTNGVPTLVLQVNSPDDSQLARLTARLARRDAHRRHR